jgi:hypothetical protein
MARASVAGRAAIPMRLVFIFYSPGLQKLFFMPICFDRANRVLRMTLFSAAPSKNCVLYQSDNSELPVVATKKNTIYNV